MLSDNLRFIEFIPMNGAVFYMFYHIPQPYYSFGIQQARLTQTQTVMMAGPEKAVCDKIVTTSCLLLRSTKQTIAFLVEDLRIDEDALTKLNHEQIKHGLQMSLKRTVSTCL